METAGKLTQDGNFSWMMVDSNHASVLMIVLLLYFWEPPSAMKSCCGTYYSD